MRRSIQHQHLGQLALPAAEFLAVTHNTSYAGYSAERSLATEQPFFQTGAAYFFILASVPTNTETHVGYCLA